MPLTQFPEPADLNVDFVNRTGDSRPVNVHPWGVENPHPGFGKDPNILNEYGHTKYPMYVGSVIVRNPEEEVAARGEEAVLKDDGPTIEEYVKAGFKASTYPPKGYASKSSEEDVKKAVAAEAWAKK